MSSLPKPLGRPSKPDAIHWRTHPKKTTALARVEPGSRTALKPPRGLLPITRGLWKSYWQSHVSRAAEVSTDQHLLYRWIEAIDEWQRVYSVFKKTRLVKGSTGQPTLNPLAAYLRQVEQTITYAEQQLGLTPSARARLGIVVGQAQLTAESLNRALDNGEQVSEVEVAEVETWEADWTAL